MKHYIFNNFGIEAYAQAHLADSREATAILDRALLQLKTELKAGGDKAEALPRLAYEVYAQWKELAYRGFISKLTSDDIERFEKMLQSSPDADTLFTSIGSDLTFNVKQLVRDWYSAKAGVEVTRYG